MAVTHELSTQAAIAADPTLGKINPTESGVLRIARFTFTQGAAAGDATSTATLVRMPAGRVRILGALSEVRFSAFGASRLLDVGRPAVVDITGETVAASTNGLADDINVASAGRAALVGEMGVDTPGGFPIVATVAGGTIPAAATLSGYIAYLHG